MEELMKKMRQNAKAYNHNLTDEYLEKLDANDLFCFTHPLDRGDFVREYRKLMAVEEVCDE